eukprot:164657-Pleurochrysis_carterae.AAC.3
MRRVRTHLERQQHEQVVEPASETRGAPLRVCKGPCRGAHELHERWTSMHGRPIVRIRCIVAPRAVVYCTRAVGRAGAARGATPITVSSKGSEQSQIEALVVDADHHARLQPPYLQGTAKYKERTWVPSTRKQPSPEKRASWARSEGGRGA